MEAYVEITYDILKKKKKTTHANTQPYSILLSKCEEQTVKGRVKEVFRHCWQYWGQSRHRFIWIFQELNHPPRENHCLPNVLMVWGRSSLVSFLMIIIVNINKYIDQNVYMFICN